MKQDIVIVVAGGGAVDTPVPLPLPTGAWVIAADGGVDRALALGLHVDVAIGDFDSASLEGVAAAEAAGARIVRHPPDKDATDLELAIDAAVALSPGRVLVIGHDGGRLDHLLSALLLLGSDRYAGIEVDGYLGRALAHVVRQERSLSGSTGELVSLLPLHGPAEGVTTAGLAYPLQGETLRSGSSRGVSNVFAAAEARITVGRGTLIAVRPQPEAR